MKTRNLNKNYLILTIKSDEHLIPILVKNDPENPEIFNLALVYTKFRITHGQPYRGLKLRVAYIRFLMDFYTEYKPQTQAKNRTFLEDFFKAFNQGQVLGFDQITETRRSRAVQPIRDFILWVVKHKEVAKENESEFVNTLCEAVEFSKKLNKSLMFVQKDNKVYDKENKVSKVLKAFPVHKILEIYRGHTELNNNTRVLVENNKIDTEYCCSINIKHLEVDNKSGELMNYPEKVISPGKRTIIGTVKKINYPFGKNVKNLHVGDTIDLEIIIHDFEPDINEKLLRV